ncbi:MAG: hypothetical protein A2Z36_00530 [Chloroflexi bacterium RBG_19FT_COMBO_48_23]|nr:MAG: hypothetical protein A2Z36_00530 [Chloroflexi bacterium RBG_19FT_COMBO_48_23]
MLKRIGSELARHVPFTAAGAVSGIVIMAIVVIAKTPANISETIFYILHPAHIIFSAIVTTAMYKRYSTGKLWAAILIGYTGSIGIATLSDAVVPYLGGEAIKVKMEFHLPFIEEWWLINPVAFLGIAIGYLRPMTKLPHAAHVFLSTWASLFYFTAFGATNWMPLLPLVLLFLFLAVWIPCCFSDIVYPHLFLGGEGHHHHEIDH